MNTDLNANSEANDGQRTILTIRVPSSAAEKMLAPGFLPRINEQLAKIGLPPVEAIEKVDEAESRDRQF